MDFIKLVAKIGGETDVVIEWSCEFGVHLADFAGARENHTFWLQMGTLTPRGDQSESFFELEQLTEGFFTKFSV